jgi:thiamine-phosphate pyrophosphorylase
MQVQRRLPPALVALTTADADAVRSGRLERAVAAALDAGLAGVMVREPDLDDGPLVELARRIARAAAQRGVDLWLAIHDRVHLVESTGAHAVHLGSQSLTPRAARPLLPPTCAIGFSSHSWDTPERWDGADYLFLAPIRETSGKPVVPIGFESIEPRARQSGLPVWALGGIAPGDLSIARAAGASGVAVLSGVLGAADPARAVRAFLEQD